MVCQMGNFGTGSMKYKPNFLGLLNHKLVSSETFSRFFFLSWIPFYWNFKSLHSNRKCAKWVKIYDCKMDRTCSVGYFCLCWGLTSQSTIFQSCRDRATASWVINQYFRGVKCLAQGHNTAAIGFEPPTSRSPTLYHSVGYVLVVNVQKDAYFCLNWPLMRFSKSVVRFRKLRFF